MEIKTKIETQIEIAVEISVGSEPETESQQNPKRETVGDWQNITIKPRLEKANLNKYHYTISLLQEGYRAGLISKSIIECFQGQLISILQDLILRYTQGESSSVMVETAESILNSIFYCIDAYTITYENPEDILAFLETRSLKDIYQDGLDLVKACVNEAKLLYLKVRKNKLTIPMEVYKTSIDEALPGFFRDYRVVFNAHDTTCMLDYPLVFDDMNVEGVFYIKQYLLNLETETQFCRFFPTEDIIKTLARYGQMYGIDYKVSPINVFEVVINNSVFSVLAGNTATTLNISKAQFEVLRSRLSYTNNNTYYPAMLASIPTSLPAHSSIPVLVNAAFQKLVEDLSITQPNLLAYIQRYQTVLLPRLLNAVQNDSLQNLIVVDPGDAPDLDANTRNAGVIFKSGDNMKDSDFRSLVASIMECANGADKLTLIASHISSVEDFVDVLQADCLFGNELNIVFASLSDIELALLGKIVFAEELRNEPLNLYSILCGTKRVETEWQKQYIHFIKNVGPEKTAILQDLLLTIGL